MLHRGRRRPAHGEAHPLSAEERLRLLGERVPELEPEVVHLLAHERASRVVPRALWGLVSVVVVALVALQLLRPVPTASFEPVLSAAIRLPGSLPALPWPAAGSAALAAVGGGSLGHSGLGTPVPVAGLAKVLSAYQVLRDHPLAPGRTGPSITVTSELVSAYHSGLSIKESEVPVATGESLTELQALEGLLVAGGNDMATLLADWDAGSVGAFVTKANATARALGLDSTHLSDASGLDPSTVSSPADLLRLGEDAMAVPVLAQIVGMAQVTLPLAGTLYNTDADLGAQGIAGIETGYAPQAGGCFLFDATQRIDGQSTSLVGVVLGQQGVAPGPAALQSAVALVGAAFAAARRTHLLAPGQVVGRIAAPWGPSVPVVSSGSPSVVAWPGLALADELHLAPLADSIPSDAAIGTLEMSLGSTRLKVVLRTTRALKGPSLLWRLTRL